MPVVSFEEIFIFTRDMAGDDGDSAGECNTIMTA